MGLNSLVHMNFMKTVLNHGLKTQIHAHVVESLSENNIHCFNDLIFFHFFQLFLMLLKKVEKYFS
jgi:hypothetical protein